MPTPARRPFALAASLLLLGLSLSAAVLIAGCRDVSPTDACLRGGALLPERLYGEATAEPAMAWAPDAAAKPAQLGTLLVLFLQDGILQGRLEQSYLSAAGDTLTLVTELEAGLGATWLETAPDGGRSVPGGTEEEAAGAALRLSGS